MSEANASRSRGKIGGKRACECIAEAILRRGLAPAHALRRRRMLLGINGRRAARIFSAFSPHGTCLEFSHCVSRWCSARRLRYLVVSLSLIGHVPSSRPWGAFIVGWVGYLICLAGPAQASSPQYPQLCRSGGCDQHTDPAYVELELSVASLAC